MLSQPPLRTITAVIAGTGLCLALAACGPTATTNPPTSAPAATAAGAAPTVATAAPTVGSLPTAAARPTQTAAADPPATTAADPVRLVLDPAASEASYHAREQLVGKTLPSDAVGTSKGVSGNVVLGPDGSVMADQSQISVDMTKLQSNESRRDNFIKGDTLQTSRFPTATFVPNQVQGLPMPLPTSGQMTFQISGDLTVHGVTKPATWQVTAQFSDTTITGTATTDVKITDFGMTPPRAGPVLSIEDGLTLEMVFTATRG